MASNHAVLANPLVPAQMLLTSSTYEATHRANGAEFINHGGNEEPKEEKFSRVLLTKCPKPSLSAHPNNRRVSGLQVI